VRKKGKQRATQAKKKSSGPVTHRMVDFNPVRIDEAVAAF
jgi:hypothetical protein